MGKAQETRLDILQKAFELIYANGYKTTSIDQIIATTQVTKGAFFYNFKTKDEMGIAIIKELMMPRLTQNLVKPLQTEVSPLEAIYRQMDNLLTKNEFLKLEFGCPIANFTHEMSQWNADFNKVLKELTGQWTKAMAEIIENGKEKGFVRKDVDAKQATVFILSGYWGIRNLGKLEHTKSVYKLYLKELKSYLNTLQ
ncbi:TetR/AcrR family transcriptional regulator [Mucilaginibacter sp. L196]|uniref:TetR/AcrR family transcriptional regulator n=1 Tax=Mucilaginibacter sp. L196 TaxID=1641870 RepID=UPI00131E6760|nr:helix-turn-helix domain-containing protein [Mucilaginibacter sp. L196]